MAPFFSSGSGWDFFCLLKTISREKFFSEILVESLKNKMSKNFVEKFKTYKKNSSKTVCKNLVEIPKIPCEKIRKKYRSIPR